jgi:hypothetical protein
MNDTTHIQTETPPGNGEAGRLLARPPCSAFPLHVQCEIERARTKHRPINSAHEGYAVILEELDEFWDEVKKKRELRDKRRMYDELVEIAAMAQRTAEDVLDTPNSVNKRRIVALSGHPRERSRSSVCPGHDSTFGLTRQACSYLPGND